MDKAIKNKRGLELVTGALHKNFSISYIWSDQVCWCNIKWFLSYSKNYTCKLMQANSWRHILFYFHLFFWIWKVWKGRGEITKSWISRERKKLFRWNKKHFSQFLKGYHVAKKEKFDKKYWTQALTIKTQEQRQMELFYKILHGYLFAWMKCQNETLTRGEK